jgi:hypothetical protein
VRDVAVPHVTHAVYATTRRRYRPEMEGLSPNTRALRLAPDSPLLRVVARCRHDVRSVAAAVGTAEPQVDQRHIAGGDCGESKFDAARKALKPSPTL